MDKSEKLFTRKFNDLRFLIIDNSEYSLLKASAILRLFLIDGNSLIDIVNKKYRLKIVYQIDTTFNINYQDGSRLICTPTKIGDLAVRYSRNLQNFKRDEFLKLQILETKLGSFSVREIIKFLANKEGGVHYEVPKNDEPLNKIDFSTLLKAIIQIGRIVLLSLERLKNELIKYPNELPILAHFKSDADKHIFFQGNKQFLETRDMQESIKNGFGLLFELNILHQPKSGDRIIYEVGGDKYCFNFKAKLTNNGSLECISKINSSNKIVVSYPNYINKFSNQWISVACFFDFENNVAKGYLYLNSKEVDRTHKKYKNLYRKVAEQTIGSNLKGKQNCAFKLIDLIIIKDKLDNSKKELLLNYFEGNWKK